MHALKKLAAVEADVAEAAAWYETQRPGLGERFVFAVQSADKLLLANPLRYSVRFSDVRRLNLADFPYGLFFFLHGDEIVVLAVLHHRRDTRAILERRRRLA
jgi:plasmid stabilization system protein ParE